MKKYLFTLLCLLATLLLSAQTPDIRIRTNIYATDGASNYFTIVLGAAPGHTGYADVKCSGGNQSEVEILPATYIQNDSTQEATLAATLVACQVDEQGIVDIFCDEGVIIDYLNCTGAEVTSIEFKNPENIEILTAEHNALEQLDLTPFTNLVAAYLNDNPMSVSPLTDKGVKNSLQILEISQIENLDPEFDITRYPNLVSFDAMSTFGLKKLTPSACPKLKKISIDNTNVTELDVTQNPNLYILNISESRIPSIDISKNTHLQQFYATHTSWMNTDVKLSEIDVTHNPELIYLFLTGNKLTSLDITKNPMLRDLYVAQNHLTGIDLSQNEELINVFLTYNDMDFNTLPIPSATWGDFELKQRALQVPRSCLLDTPIDLSQHLVRSGSDTYASLFSFNANEPELVSEVSADAYTFENGILTIHKLLPDSIYASFYNTAFPDTELQTTAFKMKSNTEFGKPNLMATINANLHEGDNVEMAVGLVNASVGNQRTFYVDLGDGNLKEFRSTTPHTPAEANVKAPKAGQGSIKIYMPEGEYLTALKIENIALQSLDLSNAADLAELTLTNTRLNSLDLQWNRLLESVDITGNNFGAEFTLEGANGGYGKNLLTHINLSNNNMTSVTLNQPYGWQYIDLSHNHLSTFNFTDADNVKYLDMSYNDFEYMKINYLGQLKTFYCNNNRLSELILPENNVIEYLDCSDNNFNFATLPARNGLDREHFFYAPQAVIPIPAKGPGYNLSTQNVTINGQNTVFTWRTTDGQTLSEGSDYTLTNGVTYFNDNTIGKHIYCELTNNAYPDLTLETTAMLSAGMPTHLLGEFTTPTGGQEVRISLTSAVANDAVYIDWTGTNSLEMYPITTTYTVSSATTTAGARVKVWSYEENDNLTVFSIGNAKMTDVDLSPMKNLIFLGLTNSGISDLKWPESPNLQELDMDGCLFTTFDFSRFPKLTFVNFDNNKLTAVDISKLPNLASAGFANNYLKEIKLDNKNLWQLALGNNQLTKIDLSGAPNIEQLFLNDNKLSSIDLSPLKNLRILYLDANKFDFNTLPVPQPEWALYTYSNQPLLTVKPEDGVVDLTSQAVREGVKTTYTWIYGYPTVDYTTGEVSGELLEEGTEYLNRNGQAVFLTDIDQVCCILTNSLFPNTYLQTNVFAVTACPNAIQLTKDDAKRLAATAEGRMITVSGAPEGATFTLYTTSGAAVAIAKSQDGKAILTAPQAGIYLIATNGAAAKITVR